MPRPMAPGVLGMARTMRALAPQAARNAAMDVPAAIEIIKALPAIAARAGASPFRICGLIATTQVSIFAFTCDGAASSVMAFARASFLISADGLGSTTMMDLSLLAHHPLRSALPIRPAPTSRTVILLLAFARGASCANEQDRHDVRPARDTQA